MKEARHSMRITVGNSTITFSGMKSIPMKISSLLMDDWLNSKSANTNFEIRSISSPIQNLKILGLNRKLTMRKWKLVSDIYTWWRLALIFDKTVSDFGTLYIAIERTTASN